MVAFRLNHFIINLTACLYAWLDFINNTYQFSVCSGFYKEIGNDTNELNLRFTFFIIYKVLSSIPFAFFSSFIVISLTYRSFIELVDLILFKSEEKTSKQLFLVNDQHEIIYSKCDIDYVINLFENKRSGIKEKKIFKRIEHQQDHSYTLVKIERKNVLARLLNLTKIILG